MPTVPNLVKTFKANAADPQIRDYQGPQRHRSQRETIAESVRRALKQVATLSASKSYIWLPTF